MEFDVNSWFIWVLVAVILLVVLAQSVLFLVKALKRAKTKGMDMGKIKKTIVSAAVFTIAPAISILFGVITLSVSLGIPLPWLRLSVIGSLSYEAVAANNALAPLGATLGTTLTDASAYVTVAGVMTSGIIIGLVVVPFMTKKYQKGLVNFEKKDKKWFSILNDAMFLGMVSAFVGFVFCELSYLWISDEKLASFEAKAIEKAVSQGNANPNIHYTHTQGLIPVLVFAVSAACMAVLGILAKKTNKRWIKDYAIPICLVIGMAVAVPLTLWLG